MLADEDTWIVLDSEADLAGLPPALGLGLQGRGRPSARSPGKWAVANTRSSVEPFLTFSSRRDLREKVWKTFKSRGDNGDANDNNAIIAEILKLRAERAKLLGYATHAHWRLEDTMASDPRRPCELMMRVWTPAVARVQARRSPTCRRSPTRRAQAITIEPWDYRYYAEKVRKAKYDLDQNEVKPYFQLDNLTRRCSGWPSSSSASTFTEITGTVPVYHPDVRVWEVKDKASGRHVGLWYFDPFARQGKRSGAWTNGYRGQRAVRRHRSRRSCPTTPTS